MAELINSKVFDTHAHYDCEQFNIDREILLEKLPSENVFAVINVGVDYKSSKISVELAKKYNYIYAGVGLHPQEIPVENIENEIEKIEGLLKLEKVVGIGEIGLDYNWNDKNKEAQKFVFEEQLKLAKKHNLPVMIHDRDAHEDVLQILEEYKPKGVVHCFSGDLKMAEKILSLGMKIGVGGIVTFKKADILKEVVKNISLSEVLLETDAPYLAPVPFRGKRCDSSMIKFVAEEIAKLKSISSDEVLKVTKNNAKKLFIF